MCPIFLQKGLSLEVKIPLQKKRWNHQIFLDQHCQGIPGQHHGHDHSPRLSPVMAVKANWSQPPHKLP